MMKPILMLKNWFAKWLQIHGKAAEILEIPKYDLIELYNHMVFSYLSLDISEVEEELDNWEKLKEEFV